MSLKTSPVAVRKYALIEVEVSQLRRTNGVRSDARANSDSV